MNYTQQQFNEMAAKVEGVLVTPSDYGLMRMDIAFTPDNKSEGQSLIFDPYNDLNQLMPLAYKYKAIRLHAITEYKAGYEVWLNNLRDRLFQIWSEGNTNE